MVGIDDGEKELVDEILMVLRGGVREFYHQVDEFLSKLLGTLLLLWNGAGGLEVWDEVSQNRDWILNKKSLFLFKKCHDADRKEFSFDFE